MKKLTALLLVAVMVLSLAACGKKENEDKAKIKIGAILVGDENEGYTYSHIEGIKNACTKLGISEENVIWKYSIPEDAKCHDAAIQLVDQGCNFIISNSYSHQPYTQQAAEENPDVDFVAMTGDTAMNSGLDNFSNAFTNIYEARYVSGVVAGMKLAELIKDGKVADKNRDENGNILIGYVGAYPYAEVVSGYTAFYLGIKSVVPEVSMLVQYTNSWFDIIAEGEAANALLGKGCMIIGQHADSTGAPSAVQAAFKNGTIAYSVGYNVDMISVAPDVALTSPTNVWEVYYEYAFKQIMDGKKVDRDWSKGYNDGAVRITQLGTACAAGTQEKVDSVTADIKSGKLKVFDASTFTYQGKTLDEWKVDLTGDFKTDSPDDKNAIYDGYFHESEFRAAPSFDIRIDGITELN